MSQPSVSVFGFRLEESQSTRFVLWRMFSMASLLKLIGRHTHTLTLT